MHKKRTLKTSKVTWLLHQTVTARQWDLASYLCCPGMTTCIPAAYSAAVCILMLCSLLNDWVETLLGWRPAALSALQKSSFDSAAAAAATAASTAAAAAAAACLSQTS
jgi:hypothetical protein